MAKTGNQEIGRGILVVTDTEILGSIGAFGVASKLATIDPPAIGNSVHIKALDRSEQTRFGVDPNLQLKLSEPTFRGSDIELVASANAAHQPKISLTLTPFAAWVGA
ncbi:hypothetical protein MASR1M49_25920 [Pararhodobacter aggregans]